VNKFWEWYSNNYGDELGFLLDGYVKLGDIPHGLITGRMIEYLQQRKQSYWQLCCKYNKNSSIDNLDNRLKNDIEEGENE
jgi:hypothetical protein